MNSVISAEAVVSPKVTAASFAARRRRHSSPAMKEETEDYSSTSYPKAPLTAYLPAKPEPKEDKILLFFFPSHIKHNLPVLSV